MTAIANTISSYINTFFHTEEYDDIHLQQLLSYTYYTLFHDHLNFYTVLEQKLLEIYTGISFVCPNH
jgi:hypothetical protein